MTSAWKTYRVSFCVRDYYSIELKAQSDAHAEALAEELYDRVGEEIFTFDVSRGGTDDWEVKEHHATSINESNDNA